MAWKKLKAIILCGWWIQTNWWNTWMAVFVQFHHSADANAVGSVLIAQILNRTFFFRFVLNESVIIIFSRSFFLPINWKEMNKSSLIDWMNDLRKKKTSRDWQAENFNMTLTLSIYRYLICLNFERFVLLLCTQCNPIVCEYLSTKIFRIDTKIHLSSCVLAKYFCWYVGQIIELAFVSI